jgi:hypothetical protein
VLTIYSHEVVVLDILPTFGNKVDVIHFR